jgi:hypothetical protein
LFVESLLSFSTSWSTLEYPSSRRRSIVIGILRETLLSLRGPDGEALYLPEFFAFLFGGIICAFAEVKDKATRERDMWLR